MPAACSIGALRPAVVEGHAQRAAATTEETDIITEHCSESPSMPAEIDDEHLSRLPPEAAFTRSPILLHPLSRRYLALHGSRRGEQRQPPRQWTAYNHRHHAGRGDAQ